MGSKILEKVFKSTHKAFIYIGIFSLCINLLYLTVPLYMLQIFDRVLLSHSKETLIYLTLVAIIGLLTLALLDFTRSQIMLKVGEWIDRILGPKAIERSPDEYLKGNELAGQSVQDIRKLRLFISSNALAILFDTPWVPVYILIIFLLHPILGVIALLSAIILFGLAVANEIETREISSKFNESNIKSQLYLSSALRNAETIQAMGMLSSIKNIWAKENDEGLLLNNDAKWRSGILLSISKFVRLTSQILILGVGAYLVVTSQFSPGAMIAGSILLSRALAPVEQSITAWSEFLGAREAYKRLKHYFTHSHLREKAMSLPTPEGYLSVEKLTYIKKGLNRPILENISFNLNPGEVLTILGPSASGKTTLARMIVGVLEPTAGIARLDGANVYTWNRNEFGNHVGYLPQSIELFVGSVQENIARMQTPDPKAIVEASKKAGCHELILALQNGYDTVLKDQGRSLSGGQRQRIALARALYNNPCLVILDEPNSSLDESGQMALVDCIKKLREEKVTTILITHLPNLIDCADKLMLIQEGKMIAFGPRAKILERIKQAKKQVKLKNEEGKANE